MPPRSPGSCCSPSRPSPPWPSSLNAPGSIMTTSPAEPTLRASEPRRSWRAPLRHLALMVASFAMLYPLLWMLSSSFKPEDEIFSDLSLWPQTFTLGSYVEGWYGHGINFGRFFLNSFIVSALAVVGNLAACSLAAFAFARLQFPLKKMWFAAMLGTLMLPYHVKIGRAHV